MKKLFFITFIWFSLKCLPSLSEITQHNREGFEPISNIITSQDFHNDYHILEEVLNRCLAVNFFTIETKYFDNSDLKDQSVLIAERYFNMIKSHVEDNGGKFNKAYTEKRIFNPKYIYYDLEKSMSNNRSKFKKLLQDDLLVCALYLQIFDDIGDRKTSKS